MRRTSQGRGAIAALTASMVFQTVVVAANGQASIREISGLVDAPRSVDRVEFAPDGKHIALTRFDGIIEVWDLTTRKVQRLASELTKGDTMAQSCTFSADSNLLAVDYSDKRITVWDMKSSTERVHVRVPQESWVKGMAFVDADRSLVGVLYDDTKALEEEPPKWNVSFDRWDITTGERLASHRVDPTLRFEALSGDGRFVVLQRKDDGLFVFETSSGKELFRVKHFSRKALFSNDGSRLLCANLKKVEVWAVPSGDLIGGVDTPSPNLYELSRFALSRDNKTLAVAFVNRVTFINMESGKQTGSMDCYPKGYFCKPMHFSHDGKMLATTCESSTAQDKSVPATLKFWALPETW